MLPPPMHRCCHRHHHAATAFPNALLLPLKLCFCQAAASAAKLAAAVMLPLLPPMLPRCQCCATTAYKIYENVILLTNLFFTTMVTAACSDNGGNQLTCIEKDKPKNNKISQHEKNKPIFKFLLSFFLVQPLFCSNNHHCDCHCRPLQ